METTTRVATTNLIQTSTHHDPVSSSSSTILLMILLKKLFHGSTLRKTPKSFQHRFGSRERRDIDSWTSERLDSYYGVRLGWVTLQSYNGFFLRIHNNGSVDGTQDIYDLNTALEFNVDRVGEIYLRGVYSGRFLSMDSKGKLTGQKFADESSRFTERLLSNKFSAFSNRKTRPSRKFKDCYITLDRRGQSKSGCRVNINNRSTHFLPRYIKVKNQLELFEGDLF